MYKSFRVQNFKGLKDLELNDLKQINLIAGKNNIGKTTLLDSLFLYSGGYVAGLAIRIQQFRGINAGAEYWNTLFHELDTDKIIRISGEAKNIGQRSMELEILRQRERIQEISSLVIQDDDSPILSPERSKVMEWRYQDYDGSTGQYHLIQTGKGIQGQPPPPPAVHGVYLRPNERINDVNTERFTELLKNKREGVLLDALRLIDSRIVDITSSGEEILVDIGLKQRVPIGVTGGGIIQLAGIVLAMAEGRNEIVLIDEIENGFHHSVLIDVWKLIKKLAVEFGVQVFATTHSREAIDAVYDVFKDQLELLRLQRLDRDKKTGEIYPTTYDEYSMQAAMEVNAEVR